MMSVIDDVVGPIMAQGIQYQEAGDNVGAETCFRRILQTDPDHADALQALGVLYLVREDAEGALPLLARSLRSRYQNAAGFSNLSAALRSLNRLDQALIAGREAVIIDPTFAMAHHNLSAVLLDMGDHEGALEPLRTYITLKPEDSGLQRFLLATSLMALKRFEEAEPVWLALLDRVRDDGRAWANLGVTLKNMGRHDEAIRAYRRAITLMPDEIGILNNLGLSLSMLDEQDAVAEIWLRRAIQMSPNFADAWLNLGLVLRNRNSIDQAIGFCQQALSANPDHVEAHTLLGTCLLLKGRLREGFAEYEWRTRLTDFPTPAKVRSCPAWTGADPAGLTILVHDEQGMGDGIQFVRYAPILRRLGAQVLVECADPLRRLFNSVTGIDSVVPRSAATPAYDAHVSMMSLPHILGSETVPADIPYLTAEPDLEAVWGRILAGAKGLRVGLVWAGNPAFKDDRRRSPGLAAMAPLLTVPGVSFFGLQKGEGRAGLDALSGILGDNFTDLGPQIRDWADTAAIMTQLDLVISSCTAPPHLAGALGRPVWTILPLNADWRWGEVGDISPWYPSMRLFRQERSGDWGPVVMHVRQALVREVAAHGNRRGASLPHTDPK